MRNGHPEAEFQLLTTYSYDKAFVVNDYGSGSAIALVTVAPAARRGRRLHAPDAEDRRGRVSTPRPEPTPARKSQARLEPARPAGLRHRRLPGLLDAQHGVQARQGRHRPGPALLPTGLHPGELLRGRSTSPTSGARSGAAWSSSLAVVADRHRRRHAGRARHLPVRLPRPQDRDRGHPGGPDGAAGRHDHPGLPAAQRPRPVRQAHRPDHHVPDLHPPLHGVDAARIHRQHPQGTGGGGDGRRLLPHRRLPPGGLPAAGPRHGRHLGLRLHPGVERVPATP